MSRTKTIVATTSSPITDATSLLRRDSPQRPQRLLNKSQLLDRVPLSYPSIWDAMKRGAFPRSRVVGRRVMWVEAEVDDWILQLEVKDLGSDSD
jgi:predicted DNA-binding transcriptional regulator AlpA